MSSAPESILGRKPGDQIGTAPHRSEVTVLVTDLGGFRELIEVGEPEVVVTVLQEMHAAISEIVEPRGGTIFDHAGDSVLIMFNDPKPLPRAEAAAVMAALEIVQRFRALSDRWKRVYGFTLPMKIGIHTGFTTVGLVGPPGRERYGPVGRVVVFAVMAVRQATARVPIVVTQRVAGVVGDLATLEPLPDMTDGIAGPLRIFGVVGPRGQMTGPATA